MPSADSLASKPQPATVPQALKQPCDKVVALPDRALQGPESARLWGKDRAALAACGARHSALARATDELERQGQ